MAAWQWLALCWARVCAHGSSPRCSPAGTSQRTRPGLSSHQLAFTFIGVFIGFFRPLCIVKCITDVCVPCSPPHVPAPLLPSCPPAVWSVPTGDAQSCELHPACRGCSEQQSAGPPSFPCSLRSPESHRGEALGESLCDGGFCGEPRPPAVLGRGCLRLSLSQGCTWLCPGLKKSHPVKPLCSECAGSFLLIGRWRSFWAQSARGLLCPGPPLHAGVPARAAVSPGF